ncbi:MAG TPA: hypothetical protein VGX48_21035 [Pyrinomonadaceae bacterium]|jgi:hypothetical protein|nr:hypothetical protein [Pyrinomonadaceae bacterium]
MTDRILRSPLQDLTDINDLVRNKDFQFPKGGNLPVLLTHIKSAVVVRREDFLFLTFLFSGFGMKDRQSDAPTLVRTGKEALITVAFPQQSIGEQAFYQAEQKDGFKPSDPKLPTSSDPVKFPAQARLSGISWLTFRIPDEIKSIPYTLEALLDWGKWKLQVTTPDGIPKDGLLASAIEAPFRLLLAPEPGQLWAHESAPVNHDGAVELWHTRLFSPPFLLTDGSTTEVLPRVRVAWARDFDPANGPPPLMFRNSLTQRQRTELVLLTSTRKSGFNPRSVAAHKLMLTSLGAYLDLRGEWDDDYRLNALAPVLKQLGVQSAPSMSSWQHSATLGRDHYVRVVEEGSLFPFGHRAALVTVTERRFHATDSEQPQTSEIVAALFQKMYVVVREPVRVTSAKDTDVVKEGDLVNSLLPFKSVRINDRVTPVIDPPKKSSPTQVGTLGEDAFWVVVGGKDYKFNLVGTDWEGHPCEFGLPLIFVKDSIKPADIGTLISAYNKLPSAPDAPTSRRRAKTFGRMIAYTPTEPASAGDTAYETHSVAFEARQAAGGDKQPYRPALNAAEVRITAVEQLAGTASLSEMAYAAPYRTSGFKGQNKGEVFAELVGDKPVPSVNFDGQAQRSGGVVTPNFNVIGLSRLTGAVGGVGSGVFSPSKGVAALADGNFDPAQYFVGAKLLGGISLADVVATLDANSFDAARVPKLNTSPVFEKGGETPVALETLLEWKPLLKTHPVLKPQSPGECLTLRVKARTDLQGGKQEFSVFGQLQFFAISFADVIEVAFDSLTFEQPAGSKMDVSAELPKPCVRFRGPLAFLNQLAALIDSAGFKDPPFLDVSAGGARLGYTLGLPPLTIGAYALQNVTLGAALNIPFTGEAIRVRFNFSERQSPFLLTVSGFAGGGFLGLALGADGIESIEAALEFGGNVALNLGVASGGVCVMGGFYFGSSANALTFTAYVRANGVLEVLSLIAISTEFYLGLSYSKVGPSNRFWGQASVTVEVEVAFFSKSVSMTVEREFAGGDGDPTFQQLMSEKQYVEEYRAAFAA